MRKQSELRDPPRSSASFRPVLTSLEIAAWWRARIDPAEAGALPVGVDYQPGLARTCVPAHLLVVPPGSSGGAGGVLGQVPDQPDHVFGYQAADRAAGVHADDHLAGRVEDEPR
jgi:hypothetical protein